MELLETARVDAFKKHDTVLQASRRNDTLCVIWEGTAVEVPQPGVPESDSTKKPTIWYAGDWTGPLSLQPDKDLSGESETSKTHDLVAVSNEGVKVITVEFSSLHSILKSGSMLYRKYLERKSYQERAKLDISSGEQCSSTTQQLLDDALKDLNVLELLNCNSALRKLSAVQKRHLESLAEGPMSFQPNEKVWRAGNPVDKAYIIVSGSVSFSPRRRNAGSATVSSNVFKDGGDNEKLGIGATMQKDAIIVVKELGRQYEPDSVSHSSSDENNRTHTLSLEKVFNRDGKTDQINQEYEELKRGLDKRHTMINSDGSVASADLSLAGTDSQGEQSADSDEMYGDPTKFRTSSARRRRSSKLRKANKVLGRLYNRRAFTGGLVFSRGHFLGDVSKMVADILSTDPSVQGIDEGPAYGFGDQVEGEDNFAGMVIPEEEGEQLATYTSTLTAGRDGCVVLVFPKATLGPFLDQYPGLLLSLLGTQVVV